MKLVSWNVNGLRACLGKGFLDYCAQENADVICLQETKLQPEQAVFELDGYHRYFYSAEKKGYSGTAILTKQAPLSVQYGLGLDAHDHEVGSSRRSTRNSISSAAIRPIRRTASSAFHTA